MAIQDLNVFSVRDLRLRSSELVRDAEAGRVSVITKRGRPAALALPFGSRLFDLGLDKDLAVALFEKGLLTMERSAKLAGLTLDGFMDLLAITGTGAVDYPPDELEAEMKVKI